MEYTKADKLHEQREYEAFYSKGLALIRWGCRPVGETYLLDKV